MQLKFFSCIKIEYVKIKHRDETVPVCLFVCVEFFYILV